jgi:hypothetical protein
MACEPAFRDTWWQKSKLIFKDYEMLDGSSSSIIPGKSPQTSENKKGGQKASSFVQGKKNMV